jgi:hypothetical protein
VTTRKATKGAPAEWEPRLLAEPDVREAVARCESVGVSLSGSKFEKAAREVRRLDFEVYRLGGSATTEGRRADSFARSLVELRARRDALERQGRPTHELDGAFPAMEKNVERLKARIEAAGDAEDQATRKQEVERLRAEEAELRNAVARYERTNLEAPQDLEDRLDTVLQELDAAEAAFNAGARELAGLIAAKGKAEREARHGLATSLRERVLEPLARKVRDALRGKVALYARRPEKPLPSDVRVALLQAERICELADRLAGDGRGTVPFAAHLDEATRDLLYPLIKIERPRRARSELASPDAIMRATL